MPYRRKKVPPISHKYTPSASRQKKNSFSNYWIWHELVLSYTRLRKTTKTRLIRKEMNALVREIARHYLKNFLYFPIWFFKLLTPSYLKGPVTVWTNLRTIARSPEFRPLRLAVVSQAVFCFVFIRLGILIFFNHSAPADAATFGWVQTAWSTISASTATHSNDRSGWTTYTSSTLVNTSTSPGNILIATSTYTTTDDATLSTNGLATGGGFSNGTTSETVVTGGDVTLDIASAGGEILQWDASPYNLPAAISGTEDGNGAMVTDGNDAFYILQGGGGTGFYKFIPSDKTTSTLTSVPTAIPPNGGGGAMVLSGNYIYVYSGGNSNPKFYAYSISGNSWSTLTNPPSAPYGDGIGSSLAADASGNIYFAAGGATTNFFKYTVTSSPPNGSWSTSYNIGSSVGRGSRAVYDSENNDILVLTGNNGHMVSKFDIDTNTVTTYSGAPNDPGYTSGAFMVKNDDNDIVYSISGQNYAWLERLNLNTGLWAGRQTSSTPAAGNTVGYMLHKPGENRIYTTFGGTTFYYLQPSSGTWSSNNAIPGSIGRGATMIRHGNDEIYVLAGGGSSAIYRFAINAGTQYETSGTLTSATIDLKYATSTRLSWSSSAHAQTGANSVRFQVAANTDNATWNYVGPDGTAGTYFTTSDTALPGSLNGKRYYRYRLYLSTANASFTPTLSRVTFVYHSYRTAGSLISSAFNAEDDTNVLAAVSWSGTTPAGTSIKFQVRTSPDNGSWTSWMGPDGTSGTYFTDNSGAQAMPAELADGEDDRWIQYQLFLESDGTDTPILEQSTLTYVVNAPPEITITNTVAMATDGTVEIDYDVRDIDTTTGATAGIVAVTLQYCTANCSSVGNETWATAATSTLTGTFGSSVAVNSASTTQFTSYSMTWTPTSSYNNQYNGSDFKIRLRANDSEAANNIGSDESNIFVLDTTDPLVSILIDGRSTTTNTLSISVTDDTVSGLQMKLSNDSDLSSDGLNGSSGTWIPYTATSTWNLGTGGTTVYYQVRDVYGNVSANGSTSFAETPEIPGNLFFKDISNSDTEEWREFIAWQIIDEPTSGFAEYTIYRSSDGVTYTEIASQVSRIINYYLDTNIDTGTTYYYKVTAEDTDGNISSYSTVVSDNPNGTGGTDVSSPTISNVATSSLASNSVTITWETDEVSDSYVDFITEEGGDFTNAESVGLTTMRNNASGLGLHTVVLNNLIPDTTYYFRVRSLDPDGNEGVGNHAPNGFSFTTLSGPTISGVATAEVLNTQATITWNTDQDSDSYVIFSTSSDFVASTTVGSLLEVSSHEVVLPALIQNTTYYYYVQSGSAVDKNTVEGQDEYYSFRTTADLSAPVITFDSGDDVEVSDTTLAITFVTDEPATTTINYGTSISYGSTVSNNNLNTDHLFTLTGLLPGTVYYVSMEVSDVDGNRSSALEFSATTTDSSDYTPPIISDTQTVVVTDDQVLITWLTNEGATGQLHYGPSTGVYTTSSGLVATYNRTHAITLSSLTTSTEYFFIAVSADVSGNITTSSEFSFTTLEALSEESEVQLREEAARAEGVSQGSATVPRSGGGGSSVVIDKTPAIISDVAVTGITSDTATIQWNTNEDSNTLVEFGKTTEYDRGALDLANTQKHSVKLVDLTPVTTYYYRATSYDASGNRSTQVTGSFTTISFAEEVASSTENIVEEESDTKTEELFLSTMEKAGEIIRSLSGRVSVGVLESSLVEQSRIIEELSQILPLPIIGGQPVLDIGSNFATVSWTTDKSSNSLVEFAPDSVFSGSREYDQTVGEPTTSTINHSVQMKGLLPDTVYHYRVVSRTQTGSETKSQNFTFRTRPEVNEITNYKLSLVSSEEVTFSWVSTVPTDSSITYTPYRNGKPDVEARQTKRDDTLTTQHNVTVSGFEAGVLYDVELSGTDLGNNVSNKLITGFSTDGTDSAPVISQVQTDSAIIPGGKERIQIIISWNTNELSTSKVYYRKGFAPEESEFPNSTSLDQNYTKKHIVVVTNFEPATVYQFVAESVDSSGNIGRSKTLTILTPRKEESVFQVIMSNFEEMFSWVGRIRN